MMKKVIIIGAGAQGNVISGVLSRADDIGEIMLADIDIERANEVAQYVGSEKIKTRTVNAADKTGVAQYHHDHHDTPANLVARVQTPVIKLCFFGHIKPELSRDEGQLYCRIHHCPLVRSLAPAARIKRYLQVHGLETPLNDILREPRGEMEEPFMGHAELWYDRLELAGAMTTPEGAHAMELLVEDESKFVDFKRSTLWVAKEHVFIDR